MSTKKTEAATEKPAPVMIGLTEYCRRLSTRERRVESIGGFHHAMKAAGILSDTEEGYNARFAEFCNQPA